MAEPKVKVIDRLVVSKQTLQGDAALKGIAENYVKKTTEFGKLLKEVKAASAELKEALQPMLKAKGIDVSAGTDWRATEGEDKGTILVEVIQRQKPEGTRSRIPTRSI
jgi:HSP90 family molecular chaperone